MNHTGIRLEVPQALYHFLTGMQKGRRITDKRKTSLADLVIELCQCALPMYDKQGNCLLSSDSPNIGQAYESVLEIQKVNELQEKEHYLIHWEKELLVQARELNRERTLILQEREELDALAQETDIRSLKSVFEAKTESYQSQIASQKQSIEKLEKLYIHNHEKMIQKLDTILRQTAPNLLKDTILPLLPTLVSGIGSFLTNQKLEKLNAPNNKQ